MTTMTFLVNGTSIGHRRSAAWVTISEMEGGTLSFKVVQSGGTMENLHGIFFDVLDECILNTLRINAASNDLCLGDNSINKLGNVTKMNEASCSGLDYGFGLEVDESRVNRGIVNSYSFILSSTKRDLLLSDFTNIQLDYSEAGGGACTQHSDEDSSRWLHMGLA